MIREILLQDSIKNLYLVHFNNYKICPADWVYNQLVFDDLLDVLLEYHFAIRLLYIFFYQHQSTQNLVMTSRWCSIRPLGVLNFRLLSISWTTSIYHRILMECRERRLGQCGEQIFGFVPVY